MRKPVKGPALLYRKSVAKKDKVGVIAVEDGRSSIMVVASGSRDAGREQNQLEKRASR